MLGHRGSHSRICVRCVCTMARELRKQELIIEHRMWLLLLQSQSDVCVCVFLRHIYLFILFDCARSLCVDGRECASAQTGHVCVFIMVFAWMCSCSEYVFEVQTMYLIYIYLVDRLPLLFWCFVFGFVVVVVAAFVNGCVCCALF